MVLELWQIAQVRKALILFCNDNDLEPDDEVAVGVAGDLVKMAQRGVESSELMLRRLTEQPMRKRRENDPACIETT